VFGLHNLAPVLQTYAQRYPKVLPDVTLVDRQVDLVEEGFDVGIVIARQVRSASVVTRRLTTGCMTVCATPEYLATHGTPTRPEELLAHPCLSLPSEYWGDERVFTGPEGEVRVRPSNVIVANNTEMLRQFALLGMGIAILPSYLIGNDTTSGRFVRLLSDYRLPQVEINVAYPSRRHLPAKVRTFIDHLVEHFSQTPNHQLGEQWAKDGFAKPGASALDEESAPLAAHAAYAHNGADERHATTTVARPVDGELGSKLSKPSRARMPAHSPY
jgi:DNA-binding transcriptional LysR family regulator